MPMRSYQCFALADGAAAVAAAEVEAIAGAATTVADGTSSTGANLPNRVRPGPGSAKICRLLASTYSSMAACGEPSAAAAPQDVQRAAARGSRFMRCLLRAMSEK